MGLLSHTELVGLVANGVITKVSPEMINGSSIDITLGSTIMYENDSLSWSPINIAERQALNMNRMSIKESSYVLDPDEFILGHSEQEFHLPSDISADYHLKSSLGRVGLEHVKAGWCDPWWKGSVLTLELKNLTRYHKLLLTPGMRIGQMTFHRHTPVPEEHGYGVRGRYNNDKSVSGVKI
ncbi:MAG: dCTP deaminase [Janthinobacterium lividum]